MTRKVPVKSIIVIASGALTALSFYKPYLAFWVFFSLIPFIYVLNKTNRIKSIFYYSMLFSTSYYCFLLYWMFKLLSFFSIGKYTPILAGFLIIIIALFMAVISSIPMFFYKLIKKDSTNIFLFPALYVLGELLHEYFTSLPFCWGKLGVIVNGYTTFIQSSSLFGSCFISFLILLVNSFFAFFAVNRKNVKMIYKPAIIVCTILCFNFLFGIIKINTNQSKENCQVLLLQGNYIYNSKRFSSSEIMLKEYLELADKHIKADTSLIIMPETAITTTINENQEIQEMLSDYCKNNNVTILTGTNLKIDDNYYNSMIAVYPNGKLSLPYSKQILVPFGEYVPFYDVLYKIAPMLKEYNLYNSGNSSMPIKTEVGKIGGMICYESIFPSISKNSVLSGNEIISVISNDSWFGETSAIYQHHANSILRAIECNRYVLNANNTGITSVISPKGEVMCILPPYTCDGLSAKISKINDVTLYCLIGDYGILCIIIMCIYSSLKSNKLNNLKY